MTDEQWLACADPDAMLESILGRCSNRKMRLFACACCRAIGELIKDPLSWEAIEAAERFADGDISFEAMEEVCKAVQNGKSLFADASWAAAWAAAPLEYNAASECARHAAGAVARIATQEAKSLAWAAVRSGATDAERAEAWARYDAVCEAASRAHRAEQANLVREIYGNPFRPVTVVGLPLAVTELTQSLYDGVDCAFALADALEEAGQGGLAEHFRQDGWHPKGCWAVDVILGKA